MKQKPSTTPWLLYFLPTPLVANALAGLVRVDLVEFGLSASAYILTLAGAKLVSLGLEREQLAKKAIFPSRPLPRKAVGGAMVGTATALAAWGLTDYGIIGSVLFGGGAWAGTMLSYGMDFYPANLPQASSDEDVSATLREAEKRVLSIEAASHEIAAGELQKRLENISALAREIIGLLAERPDKLKRARKFLNTYLQGAQDVVAGYARTHHRSEAPQLEQNFRTVLDTIETSFEEQKQHLIADEVMNLDVQIEVLRTQLEREGVR